MIRIKVSEDEVARLEQVLHTDDGKLRHRAQAVLMAFRGRLDPQNAPDLAVNRRTVQWWLNAYDRVGLDALVLRKESNCQMSRSLRNSQISLRLVTATLGVT